MQEWLKDKKNLPIVGTIGVLVLIGAIVLILFEMQILPPQPAPTPIAAVNDLQAPSPRVPGPGAPPLQVAPGRRPPGVTVPGAGPSQAAAGATVPAAPPNVAKGPDPFKVPGYHPFSLTPELRNSLRVRNSLPPIFIQKYPNKEALAVPTTLGTRPIVPQTAPEVSTTMRMSGVITSDTSIKALLESNGVSTQVQPGDTVDGGKVLSIQPDGLTLRTSNSRLVRVPLSGTPTGGNSPYGGNGGDGNSPGGGFPGGAPNAPGGFPGGGAQGGG